MAQWGTACGRYLVFPIERVDGVMRAYNGGQPRHATLARDARGLEVTYVPADVTCLRCRRYMRMLENLR